MYHSQVSHWVKQLCEELSERLIADLDHNKRIAQILTLHVTAYKVNFDCSSLYTFLMNWCSSILRPLFCSLQNYFNSQVAQDPKRNSLLSRVL